MSEVALQIGGRTWRVACAPGEEDRVQRLGATVAEKLASMGATGSADAQNMLFASLLLADEVLEGRDGLSSAQEAAEAAKREADTATGARDQLNAKIADLEAELTRLQSAQAGSAKEMERVLAVQTELRNTVADHEADVAKLRAELFEARKERDAARAAPAPATEVSSQADAAPALERFAEMLEQCADKLEGRAEAS